MTAANGTRAILFWTLMAFLAVALAKTTAMDGGRSVRLADFIPLMLVGLLFVVVLSADRMLKRRGK